MIAALAAHEACIHTVRKEGLGNADAPCGDVFVQGHACGGLKNAADVGIAQIKMGGEIADGERLADVLVQVGKYFINLFVIDGVLRFRRRLSETIQVAAVDEEQKLRKYGALIEVLSVDRGRRRCRIGKQLIYIIPEALLLILVQGKPVGEGARTLQKAGGKIRRIGGELTDEIRMDGDDKALVRVGIELGDIVAFIGIDDKDIPRFDGVKVVVNQKLLPAGNGIIQLVAVVNMHL